MYINPNTDIAEQDEGQVQKVKKLISFTDPLRDDGSGVGPAGAIRVGKYKLIKGSPGKVPAHPGKSQVTHI
jgi:hypothetical protein